MHTQNASRNAIWCLVVRCFAALVIEVMPQVRFTQNIQRHIACPVRKVDGASVRAALDNYFNGNQHARGYVLDEQGALRQHMAIFINGKPLLDRTKLSDAVPTDGTIDVMQALSGG